MTKEDPQTTTSEDTGVETQPTEVHVTADTETDVVAQAMAVEEAAAKGAVADTWSEATDEATTDTAEGKEAPTVSDGLVAVAESMGVPATFARTFSDDKSLHDHLAMRSAMASQTPPAKPVVEQAAEVVPDPLAPVDLKPFELEAPDGLDDYDETLSPFIKKVVAMNEHYREQLGRMQETINRLVPMGADVQSLRETAQISAQSRSIAVFDKFIADLPEAYHDVLGTKPTAEEKDPVIIRARRAIYEDATKLLGNMGHDAPSPVMALNYGLMKNFGTIPTDAAAPAAKNGRSRQTISRPTHRSAAVVTTEADLRNKEADEIRNYMIERGSIEEPRLS